MTTFTTRAERRIGVIEVTGALDDDAIVGLRGAIAEAVGQAGVPRILIVADGITAMSENAALMVVIECATLRAQGGNAAWIMSKQEQKKCGMSQPMTTCSRPRPSAISRLISRGSFAASTGANANCVNSPNAK